MHPRSGLVLTPAGGLMARLLPLARLGLCPRFGAGTQVMSWVSLADEIGAIRFLMDRKDVSGPVNVTAPEPVTNAAFTAALKRRRPDAGICPEVARARAAAARRPGRGLREAAQQYPGDP